ncbi:glycosyl hydrolase family 3 N terminal domain-containing protein [Aspergillus novoparasiticus]|uniref:beta-glucosidase n=1 Tax=Aspergillus novoparasiticus TaxID=986946 RepID=A0A5N6EGV1_9EURO|nr:glycosyl hydrolase family 3 N terminal domain-containing protein [Aspergillus novoparasiticus]
MVQLKSSLLLLYVAIARSALIWDDTYFYGHSPPVYPTPNMSGTGSWGHALSKAQHLVSQMSLEEKVSLTGGSKDSRNGCGGNIPAIDRLGFPGMCLQDGPNGIKGVELVNGYPSGIHVGASWNKSLAYKQAKAIGGEFRRKGATLALGPPVVGPLGRIALGGRNWEGYTNDPYLSGILGAEAVRGVQDTGVISCAKHFVGNEQEMHRNPRPGGPGNRTVEASSSNMDDRTMHELYMWPFADVVHAGVASVMCAYQRLNNSYSCHNSKALNGLLKTELDFQGFVLSDWGAQHTGIASALAGLDMVMPDGNKYWGAKLIDAVRNGSVPESQITNMATRIMAAWYLSSQDDPSLPPVGAGIPADFERQHPVIDARDPHDESLLLEGAIQGHVLLKNVDNALPLTNPRILSIYGYDAKAPDSNFAKAGLNDWTLGLESHDYRTVVCGFASIGGDCPDFPPIAINGTIISGGGSAAVTPVYISSPFQALEARARQDKTQLFWDFKGTEAMNSESDACLVFINAASSEGVDRPALRDDYSDGLVLGIASRCNNTIVVIHNAGVRLIDQWIEHPNVTAVIFAHLPGQDSGDAITQILYGDVSPSGKLPYSLPRNESDYGSLLTPVSSTGWDQLFPQDDFTEGVFIDYRAFDMKGIAPRFEFGFGMTYTTFRYSNLTIRWTVDLSDLSEYPVGPVIPGGNADLWENIAVVTADITNTGQMEAAEIAQLYVQIPGEGQPLLQLRGFDKVAVPPGETRTVDFNIRRRDLSTWDVTAQKWKLSVGVQYPIFVGSSSRKLLLNGTLYL